MIKGSQTRITLFLWCIAALTPVTTMAGLIDGSQLHIAGDAQVGATALNWHCNLPGDTGCATAAANQGDLSVTGSTGSFAQYNGTFGLITDINNAAQPLNTPFSLPNFITFQLNNDITIELTFIPLGTNTASTTCAGLTHCTPQNGLLVTPTNPAGLSAFNLDQNANGTSATFGVRGVVHSSDGSTADLNGIFSAEFAGLDPEQTLAAAVGGSNSTYSSNMNLILNVIPTPEPATSLITGIGLVSLALLGKRIGRSRNLK